MHKFKVLKGSYGDTEIVEADSAEVGDDGSLSLYDEGGSVVNAYAQGEWKAVVRLSDAGRKAEDEALPASGTGEGLQE